MQEQWRTPVLSHEGLLPKRYNLLKKTFILAHDFSRLGSWLPGPMSFTEHSGRNMWGAQLSHGIRSGGCGWGTWARLWLCPHFILPGLPGHLMVLLTLKMCLSSLVTVPRINHFWKRPFIFTQRCQSLALDIFQSITLTK